MATRKQHGWVGRGPVVSVRLEPELIDRLDTLAERTGRSRGTYLRMALWAALPSPERMHWEQVAADFEELAIKDAFEEITLGLMEDALKKDRKGHHDNRGGDTAPPKRGRADAPNFRGATPQLLQFKEPFLLSDPTGNGRIEIVRFRPG